MSKAILMMLLAVVSNSALAEWTAIRSDEKLTYYADLATIRKEGNMVKMGDMIDFKMARQLGGKPYMSMMSQTEYDCKKKQMRTLASSLRSGNMGKGESVASSADAGKWEPVAPGTSDKAMWEIACGK